MKFIKTADGKTLITFIDVGGDTGFLEENASGGESHLTLGLERAVPDGTILLDRTLAGALGALLTRFALAGQLPMDEPNKPYLERVRPAGLVRIRNACYGDDRVCRCGHRYRAHFDPDDTDAGCLLCHCGGFVECDGTPHFPWPGAAAVHQGRPCTVDRTTPYRTRVVYTDGSGDAWVDPSDLTPSET